MAAATSGSEVNWYKSRDDIVGGVEALYSAVRKREEEEQELLLLGVAEDAAVDDGQRADAGLVDGAVAEAVGKLLERHLAHLQHPDRAPMLADSRFPCGSPFPAPPAPDFAPFTSP